MRGQSTLKTEQCRGSFNGSAGKGPSIRFNLRAFCVLGYRGLLDHKDNDPGAPIEFQDLPSWIWRERIIVIEKGVNLFLSFFYNEY